MSNRLNPACKKEDLHPVMVRLYNGCCSPLCEEIMDHERTCDILEDTKKKLVEITATLSRAQEQAFIAGFTAGKLADGTGLFDWVIKQHYDKWLLEAMQ